ncbi:hypothetical protein VFPPC_17009 [Pochonia chlamydosporia 170]|uniref:Uncharacterized protein n=1 Tax=Pochonia chlamydosporia 170 TaxID=1380566 RepID=A0A179EYP7_METCM|nr:hypothetical protein VFPPC_17009 [Pochonia chlamydosporia 170]OAQ58282.1 hypothetical protein VFPPC_17009 [Pochonia chlamydosporia 170]
MMESAVQSILALRVPSDTLLIVRTTNTINTASIIPNDGHKKLKSFAQINLGSIFTIRDYIRRNLEQNQIVYGRAFFPHLQLQTLEDQTKLLLRKRPRADPLDLGTLYVSQPRLCDTLHLGPHADISPSVQTMQQPEERQWPGDISNPTKKHRSIQGNTLPSISPFTSRDKDHDLESRYARSSLAQPYSTNLLFSKELCDKVELDGCMTPPAIRAVCRESQWTCGQVGSLVHNICGSRRSGWFNPAIDEVFTKINRRESLPLLIFAWRWEE